MGAGLPGTSIEGRGMSLARGVRRTVTSLPAKSDPSPVFPLACATSSPSGSGGRPTAGALRRDWDTTAKMTQAAPSDAKSSVPARGPLSGDHDFFFEPSDATPVQD